VIQNLALETPVITNLVITNPALKTPVITNLALESPVITNPSTKKRNLEKTERMAGLVMTGTTGMNWERAAMSVVVQLGAGGSVLLGLTLPVEQSVVTPAFLERQEANRVALIPVTHECLRKP
jgi:hypothetical protein